MDFSKLLSLISVILVLIVFARILRLFRLHKITDLKTTLFSALLLNYLVLRTIHLSSIFTGKENLISLGNIAPKDNIFYLISLLVPPILFSYLFALLRFNRQRYLVCLIFLIPLVLRLINPIYVIKTLTVYGINLPIGVTISTIAYAICMTFISYELITNKKLESVIFNWVLGLSYIYSLTHFKILQALQQGLLDGFENFIDESSRSIAIEQQYLNTASLTVIFMCIFLLRNQRILTGDIFVKQIAQLNDTVLVYYSKTPIWFKERRLDRVSEASDKEMNLLTDIEVNRLEIFRKIQLFELNYLNESELFPETLYEFSQKTNLSLLKLEMLFKYSSNYSYSNYKKLMQTIKATVLVRQGFLKDHTADQLAETIGITNRINLHNYLKKFFFTSVQKVKKEWQDHVKENP